MAESSRIVPEDYYGASYFAWQSPGGVLAAEIDRWKFEAFLSADDVTLDFGCGGGYLLATLRCGDRYGIEVNPVARNEAARSMHVYSAIDEVPGDIRFSRIISHHALEHVEDPIGVLRKLAARLTPGGKAIFVVPSEEWRKQKRYRSGDINQHVYTWTPLSLGNLFTHAGFSVESVELLCHSWLPKAQVLYRVMPSWSFHLGCHVWAAVRGIRQIRIVASRAVDVSLCRPH